MWVSVLTTPGTLFRRSATTSAICSWSETRTMAMRSMAPFTRVNLAHCGEIGDFFSHLRYSRNVSSDEHDGSDHVLILGSSTARSGRRHAAQARVE